MELGVGINMTKEGAIGRGLNVVLYIPANLGQGDRSGGGGYMIFCRSPQAHTSYLSLEWVFH